MTPTSSTVDTFQTAFLGSGAGQLQLTASASPSVNSLNWSGGSTQLDSAGNSSIINANTGLITYTTYSMKKKVTFTVSTGDGRLAESVITFQSGGPGSKLSVSKIVQTVGDSQEYQLVNSTKRISVSRMNVTVTSSDEQVFTPEILTTSAGTYGDQDLIDKLRINAIGSGTAVLTITVKGNSWSCPVVIQSKEETLSGVTLSQNTVQLRTGDSLTLEAEAAPLTAYHTICWKSSDTSVLQVEDGTITGLKAGKATVTVTATDAMGNCVTASCEVSVEDLPYEVEVYVPKNILSAQELYFYPSSGEDDQGRDTYEDNSRITDVTLDQQTSVEYDIYRMSLASGTYSYRIVDADGNKLGGAAFAFPNSTTASVDGQTVRVYLRQAEVSLTNSFGGKKAESEDFAPSLSNEISAATPGQAYVNTEGNPAYPFLLPVGSAGSTYYLSVSPSQTLKNTYQAQTYCQQGLTMEKNVSTYGIPVELATGAFTINAPADAEVSLCEQVTTDTSRDKKRLVQHSWDQSQDQEDGSVDYIFYTTFTKNMYYRVSGPSYVTYNGTVAAGSTDRLVISADMLQPQGNTKKTQDRNYRSNGGANVADLYMNINAKGYLQLSSGDSYQLDLMRNWWGSNVTWVLDRDYYRIEPDYHYQVLNLQGQEDTSVVKVTEDGQLQAVGAGTAIVLVTYDAMTLNYHDEVKYSYEGYDPNGFYGAIWSENTGVFVVGVDQNSGGFSVVKANEDGSYSLPLTEGRNIVRLVKENQVEYQVITAKQVSVTVNGQNLEDAVLAPGEKVSVVFDTLFNPVNRMRLYNTDAAAIYRSISGMEGKMAGNARGSYGYYFFGSNADKQTIQSLVSEGTDGSSYGNPVVTVEGDLVVPGDYQEDTFTLSQGCFNVAGFGADYGEHRSGYRKWTTMSPNSFAYMGQLPDLSIQVGKLKSIQITGQPTKTSYYLGEKFDSSGMTVTATYEGSSGDFTKEINNFTCDTASFTATGQQQVEVSYTQNGVTKTALAEVRVEEAALKELQLTTAPIKTLYKVGESFDAAGMQVSALYSDGSSQQVTDYEVSTTTIQADTSEIILSYGGKTLSIPIQVKKVAAIEVTNPPARTSYTVGELFDPTDLQVTLTYTDGSQEMTDNYQYSPAERLTLEDTEISISYTGSDGAENLASVAIPICVTEKEEEPYESIQTYVTYSDKGSLVTGSDGTVLCNVPVRVYDRDSDGSYTMSDVFRAFHEQYYSGGGNGYSDTDSGWVTRFWGVNTSMLSYVLNGSWVNGTMTEVKDGDKLALFLYQDLVYYSDLYTWFDQDTYSGSANTDYTFTVNGLSVMNSNEESAATGFPEGAKVAVYDQQGNLLSDLTTVTDSKGQFTLNFPEDGSYTVEVSGSCSYTCAGYGGSEGMTYKEATVVPCRCQVVIGQTDPEPTPDPTPTPEEKVLLGDLNKDGSLTNADVALLLRSVTDGTEVSLSLGDLNGDGIISNADVARLLQLVTEG